MWSFTRIQKEVAKYAVGSGDKLMYRPEVVDVLLNMIPRSIPVDEAYYLERNPDVEKAIESGELNSAAEHYVEHGFFEDRLPMAFAVDESDYLRRYPDVAEGVENGRIESATAHWIGYGRFEGRSALLRFEPPSADGTRLSTARRNRK